jgi:hypothetical protein
MYARRNKASVPPLQPSTSLQPEVEAPLPYIGKLVPPPPPPVSEFLPKLNSTKEEIQLNVDVSAMFGKLNMTVLVTEMCNIPSVRREVLKLLKVPTEKEDPPIILNTMYLDWKNDNNPTFYLPLGMNDLCLNNCMLDSRASENVMSLKVMEQLGLKMTRTYGNVCGIDSKKVKVYGLCEDVEVYLIDFPHISLIMNIVVIDVPDAWGMLLLRSWYASLGGFLSMDLTHTHIPMGDGTFELLYSREQAKKHVMDPNGHDYMSECDFDVPHHIIEYDPWDLHFVQEDCIDTLLPRTNEYKEKLANFQGKESSSI